MTLEASEAPELATAPESSEDQRRRTEREEQIQQRHWGAGDFCLFIIYYFFKDIMSRQIIDIVFLLGKILKPCNIYVFVRDKMIH